MPRSVALCIGQWVNLLLNELVPLVKSMSNHSVERACRGDQYVNEATVSFKNHVHEKCVPLNAQNSVASPFRSWAIRVGIGDNPGSRLGEDR